jgi:hypothetical protein
VGLEELVDLLEHLFDTDAYLLALFVEGVELGFDGLLVALIDGELFAERGDFGLGGGAGFAFALDDFYGTENFLLERLELVGANARADGRGTHNSTSIDAGNVDWPEGNGVGIYLDAGFWGLKVDDSGASRFVGGLSFFMRFFCGEFVVG